MNEEVLLHSLIEVQRHLHISSHELDKWDTMAGGIFKRWASEINQLAISIERQKNGATMGAFVPGLAQAANA